MNRAKRPKLLALGRVADAQLVKIAAALRAMPDLELHSRTPMQTERRRLWDRIGVSSDVCGHSIEHISFASVLPVLAETDAWKMAMLALYRERGHPGERRLHKR